MERGLLLGIDVGTTRLKAVALDATGVERAAATTATPFAASATGVDMEVADLDRAVRAVVGALGPARERVAAVGVAGLAESGAPLRAGRPAGPVIAWHDGRGEATVASLERRFGPALARWTGRRVRTVSSLAKLGWLIDHGLPAPDRWLGVPELVLFLLTGAEATEHSLAARTGAYHVTEGRFLPEVIGHVLAGTQPRAAGAAGGESAVATAAGGQLGAAGGAGGESAVATAADGLFPPVRVAGEAMGAVSEGAAASHGLPAGIPVTIAGHDHLAAAVGLGARLGDLFNSVGTAETVFRRLDTAPDVDRALELDLAVTVWPGGDAWAVLASASRSGLVIDALAAHLGLDPGALDGLAIGGPPPHPPAAAPDPPGEPRHGPGESPHGPGEPRHGPGEPRHVPGEAAHPPGELVALGQGIEVPAGPPASMWTATLHALAARTAAAADRVAALAGAHRRVVVFGGGSRSLVWLRAKEAELGVPVVRSAVSEATARGAALTAGVAAGWWPAPSAGPVPSLDRAGARLTAAVDREERGQARQ